MKFQLECDEMDGLILIDKNFLKELDSDMLYALDILLDQSGRSELVCDFPDEEWHTVRFRETKSIREFCNSGKMVIWLLDSVEKECEIKNDPALTDSTQWLYLPTGRLLAVSASELIQCLSYPELEMNEIFELGIAAGWYAISSEYTDNIIDKIAYHKIQPSNSSFQNVWEN